METKERSTSYFYAIICNLSSFDCRMLLFGIFVVFDIVIVVVDMSCPLSKYA